MKTFLEWLTDQFSGEYGDATKDEVKKWVENAQYILLQEGEEEWKGRHYGDCTKQNITCLICEYQEWLEYYYRYCKNYINEKQAGHSNA